MIGRTIGNYEVQRLIAEGGMGKVYQATHKAIGRQAAVKVLAASDAANPETVSRFLTEARAVNAIRHPNIVQIFDSGMIEGGAPYLVMEYLEGETLTQALSRGGRALDEVLDWAGQIAETLVAAHAQHIVHRDLKPDNLFVVADTRRQDRKQVKVLDFGIAKLQYPCQGQLHRTRTGALLGTPLYMSPEQCLHPRDIDARSDVYSFGVILYEMVTGRPPFDGDSVYVVMNMHLNDPPAPPSSHRDDLPPRLEATILQALAKLPTQRQQSMAEVLSQLEEVQESLASAVGREACAPTGRCPPRTFGRDEILAFLTEIDDLLTGPVVMEIVGGAAALLAYGAESPTKDINSFSDFDKRIERAAALTTQRIPLRPALGHSVPRGYDDRRVRPDLPFRHLAVWVPDRYDILFMKAGRASAHDLRVLAEIHRARPFDVDIIIDRYNDRATPFGASVQHIIQQLFGPMPNAVRRIDVLTRF